MLTLLSTALLLFLNLPHLLTAQCPTCDTYSAALKSCQSETTSKLATASDKMDTAGIDCMRMKNSGTKQMKTCQGRPQTTYALDWDASLLLEWSLTCNANDEFGDEQAVACWEGQPNDLTPCVSATVRSGVRGGSGGSPSGGDAGGDGEPSMPTPETSAESTSSAAMGSFDGFGVLLILAGFVMVLAV